MAFDKFGVVNGVGKNKAIFTIAVKKWYNKKKYKRGLNMKNKGEIRWLQLSDLHMFVSTEVMYQKKELFKQFKEKVDFIVITGDLHQYGEDYSLTIQFLMS